MSDIEKDIQKALKKLQDATKIGDDIQLEGILHVEFYVSPIAAIELIHLYEKLVKLRG